MSKVRIKICGITRVEDASAAATAGADAIGIVFFEKSPRYVANLQLASAIAREVGPFVTVTALFVDASAEYVNSVLKEVPVNLLQFHGEESREYCEQFSKPYIKALRVSEKTDIPQKIKEFSSASGVLLDTYVKGIPGGTGEVFNWQLVPEGLEKPVIIAGGLNATNVVEAIQTTSPYAVDVSGGVEASPGIKDKEKVQNFITSVRSLRLG